MKSLGTFVNYFMDKLYHEQPSFHNYVFAQNLTLHLTSYLIKYKSESLRTTSSWVKCDCVGTVSTLHCCVSVECIKLVSLFTTYHWGSVVTTQVRCHQTHVTGVVASSWRQCLMIDQEPGVASTFLNQEYLKIMTMRNIINIEVVDHTWWSRSCAWRWRSEWGSIWSHVWSSWLRSNATAASIRRERIVVEHGVVGAGVSVLETGGGRHAGQAVHAAVGPAVSESVFK